MPKKSRPRTRQPVRTAPRPVRPADVAQPVTEAAAPAAVQMTARPRVAPRPVGGTQDFSYVGRDLIRIGIIATALVGGMVALKAAGV